MRYDIVKQRLSLDDAWDVWREHFHRSDALAAGDDEAFLEARIRESARKIRLASDIQQALVDVLPAFGREPALGRLLWHAHYLFFDESPGPIASPAVAPMLPARLGPAADLFYALVFLSGVEKVLARHRAHRVPREISADTLHDIELWIRDYRAKHGRWGLAERWWPSTYFSGQMFKLGRLQFLMTQYNLPFVIYRRRGGSETVALAETGGRFRADGQFHDADESIDPAAWTAELSETGSLIRGHAASASGAVQKNPVELRADEWTCILRRGGAVLDVHIPATGPMDDGAVGASFAQAEEFFPRHYPYFEFKSLICLSWLLDPQLRDHLPADSNIVRFLNRFRLLPAPGANHRQTFERVFGDADIGIDQAPSNTHLQRAIIAHVRAGGKWRMSAGIIPVYPMNTHAGV